jgi:hypothetical protein
MYVSVNGDCLDQEKAAGARTLLARSTRIAGSLGGDREAKPSTWGPSICGSLFSRCDRVVRFSPNSTLALTLTLTSYINAASFLKKVSSDSNCSCPLHIFLCTLRHARRPSLRSWQYEICRLHSHPTISFYRTYRKYTFSLSVKSLNASLSRSSSFPTNASLLLFSLFNTTYRAPEATMVIQ